MVGLVGAAYAFTGADSAAHMVEEVGNAAVRVPQAMVYGVLLNGTMGISILITLLFVLGDPDAVFDTTLAFPAYQVYMNALNSTAGTIVLGMIILTIAWASAVTFTATASRATWAFSRDKGMPGWRIFSRVDTRINLPLWSIYLTMLIAFVLSLIAFGSSLAFNDIISLGVRSSYATYILGNSLLLWRRLAGYIKPYSADDKLTNTTSTDTLSWGLWKLPEPLGIAVNIIGILYMVVLVIFSFFPTAVHPSAADMNWSCFMFGIVMIFSIVWYYTGGRKEYEGPIIEVEPGQVGTSGETSPIHKA